MLATIGQDFIRNTRASDVIGRWGGEEFVAVVRNVDSDQLLQVADKLRVIIAGSTVPGFREIRVTVSIGGLVAKKGDTAENLLAQADRCLYLSKNDGRNRVTIKS